MTSRERIDAALNHREPDRTPSFEYVLLSPLADTFLGRPYAAEPATWREMVDERGWEQTVRQSAVDRVDLAAILAHDMLYVPPNPLPPASHPAPARSGSPLTTDDPVERVRERNARHAVASPPPETAYLVYACLREEMQRRDLDLPILAPAYAHGVWTDVDLMQTMLLAPEVAREHFALATARSLSRIDAYIDLGIEQVGVGGDFAGNRPLISPAFYREFIAPEVRKLSRRLHDAGRIAVNASDGNLWSVIEDFLVGCEVDGYLEIDMHAGMDLGRLKQAYGERTTLYGNLDCGNVLSFGSVDDVRMHTLQCLEAGSGNGGHILCASNAITASVPLRNYLAVLNAYREMFGLPKLVPPPEQ